MSDNISTIYGSSFLLSLMPISISMNIKNEADDDVITPTTTDGSNQVSEAATTSALENDAKEGDKVEGYMCNGLTKRGTLKTGEQAAGHNSNHLNRCTITGFISRAGVGVGRSDNDRQFVFCNGRPVDLPKFTKILNEVRTEEDEKVELAVEHFFQNVA